MANEKTAPKFQFVGGANGSKGSKLSWPVAVEAKVIALNKLGGVSATNAFAQVRDEVLAANPGHTDLPASYSSKNAGSLLHGMRTRFLERVNKGDAETIAAARAHNLIEEVPTTPTTESTQSE